MKTITATFPVDAARQIVHRAAVDMLLARIAMDMPEYCWNAPWGVRGKQKWLERTGQHEAERRSTVILGAFGIEDFPFPNASDVFIMEKPDKGRGIRACLVWNTERRREHAEKIATEMVEAWKASLIATKSMVKDGRP